MKYLIIIFLLLSPSLSCSEDVNWDDLVRREGLYYQKFTDVPFSGNVVGKEQGIIIKGKQEGEWLEYYNGLLDFKGNYKDGKLDGEWLEYWSGGQLRVKGNYKDGYKEGEVFWYHTNGQLWQKGNYKDGRLDGEYLWYYENDQLYQTEIFKDGEPINTIKP